MNFSIRGLGVSPVDLNATVSHSMGKQLPSQATKTRMRLRSSEPMLVQKMANQPTAAVETPPPGLVDAIPPHLLDRMAKNRGSAPAEPGEDAAEVNREVADVNVDQGDPGANPCPAAHEVFDPSTGRCVATRGPKADGNDTPFWDRTIGGVTYKTVGFGALVVLGGVFVARRLL